MKLTRKQREQVVELLRCAADNAPRGGLVGMFAGGTSPSDAITDAAWKALDASRYPRTGGESAYLHVVDEHYRHELLEAAQRVEEGSWP